MYVFGNPKYDHCKSGVWHVYTAEVFFVKFLFLFNVLLSLVLIDMKNVGKIVGINLLILILYFVGVSFIRGNEADIARLIYLGIFLIPIHVIVCFITSFVYLISNDPNIKKTSAYSKGFFLSGLLVALIGFSLCTTLF